MIDSLLNHRFTWALAFVPFVLFLVLVIAGLSNGVNLTDGLDGLAIGCVLISSVALTVMTYLSSNARFAEYLEIQRIPDAAELTIFCGSLVGASLGFLWYNAHPAEVFMGDVGSLALGGAIGTIAVILKQEILMLSIGGHFCFGAAVRDHSGGLVQADGETHVSDGAAASSFRADGMERIENHRAILDLGAGVCAVFADDFEIEVTVELRPGFDLAGKRVLVVGLARTGVAVSLFAAAYGATVTATDEKPEGALERNGGAAARGGREAGTRRTSGIRIFRAGFDCGEPGRAGESAAAGARARGRNSGMERDRTGLAVPARESRGHHRLERQDDDDVADRPHSGDCGVPTRVGGNIGAPLISLVESSTDSTVTVVEISSFQLESIEAFRPEIGVLLNLTPDHLDRHASFEEYATAKMRLFENQLERDFAVLNADDPEVTKRMPSRSHVFWFSRQKRVAEGAFLLDDQIIFRLEGAEIVVGKRSEIPLRGEHNVENVLAACAAAYLAGAEPAAIARGVKTFRGVEHRLEFVGEVGGVEFFNDSKATNVDATLKAIEAFPGPLVVILGGKDKGSPYTPLRDALRARGRVALLIGEAAGEDRRGSGRCRRVRARGDARTRRRNRDRARAAGRYGSARSGLLKFRSV